MAEKLTKRKGFNFFRSYYDVYNELESSEDKIAFIEALLDRQFLGIKPTNLKGMAKFAYISQTNSIDSQVKGFEDKTGIILTPTQGGTHTPTVQEEVQVQEEVKEENKESVVPPPVFVFKKALADYGFEKPLIEDWLKVRKAKKGVNTEIAFNGFVSQVEKSGRDKNEILKICIEKSWAGFEAVWLLNIKPLQNGANDPYPVKQAAKFDLRNFIPTDAGEVIGGHTEDTEHTEC